MGSAGENKNRRQRRYSPTVERLEARAPAFRGRAGSPAREFRGRARLAGRSTGCRIASGRCLTGRSRARPGMRRSFRPSWPTSWVQARFGFQRPLRAHTRRLAAVSTSTDRQSTRRRLSSGLTQLNKYLSRAWYRAGISPQLHDDSSQAVYATLLQQPGPRPLRLVDHRRRPLGNQGRLHPRDVRGTGLLPGRRHGQEAGTARARFTSRSTRSTWLAPAIRLPAQRGGKPCTRRSIRTLSPREAALIQDTLMGKTPAEIANQWGVAPKTVSNEKTRVLQKLRLALADHEMN